MRFSPEISAFRGNKTKAHSISRLRPAAAVHVVPVEQMRTARRHCNAARPRKVKTLAELHEAIRDLNIPGLTKTLDGEDLKSFLTPRFGSLVVTTRRQLELLSTAEMIQADATYKVVPAALKKNGCTQLFTIHGRWGRHVSTPFFPESDPFGDLVGR